MKNINLFLCGTLFAVSNVIAQDPVDQFSSSLATTVQQVADFTNSYDEYTFDTTDMDAGNAELNGTKIDILNDGMYEVTYSLSGQASIPSGVNFINLESAIFVNDTTLVENSATYSVVYSTNGNNGKFSNRANFYLSLSTGDYIELKTIRESGNTSVAIAEVAGNFINLRKVGDAPPAQASNHASCKEILDAGESTGDGIYTISLDASTTYDVHCDMTTDGGGWTGITTDLAYLLNGGSMTFASQPTVSGFDFDKPYTASKQNYELSYYDIPLAFNFTEFFAVDYEVRGSSEYLTSVSGTPGNFDVQVSGAGRMNLWTDGSNSTGYGDIAIGSPLDSGPKMRVSQIGSSAYTFNAATVYSIISTSSTYTVASGNTLRFGWSQYGGSKEGVFPWWDGTFYVR